MYTDKFKNNKFSMNTDNQLFRLKIMLVLIFPCTILFKKTQKTKKIDFVKVREGGESCRSRG